MELSDLKGVGPTRLNRLRAMGISSLRDLLYFLPYRYEDQTHVSPCADRREGPVMVRGTVTDKPAISYFRGLSTVTAVLSDESGRIHLRWYNEPWMVSQLPTGTPVSLYGRRVMKNGRVWLQNPHVVKEPGWIPVYRAVRGIPARTFRAMMREALEQHPACCKETLPESFLKRNNLCDLEFAIRQTHFPETMESLQQARRRLAFEGMLLYLSCVALQGAQREPGFSFFRAAEQAEDYWALLSFPPTAAQRRVLGEIAADLEKPAAMTRLVQGDVGCGKTAIAFGALFLARKNGYQAAMMAPTEILAQQHFLSAQKILEPAGIRCRLLTGSTRAPERRKILSELAEGRCDAVFGTHALISEDVRYLRLGLVITDEQHRFGVRQRSRLREKGETADARVPHVLVMSATPIPRTLALILYGDLDLSVVDELPPGRKPVRTRLVPPEKRDDLYRFIRQNAAEGCQAYIVCPLVEDSETMEQVKSARAVWEELRNGPLKDLRVALTWGSQKSAEKAEVIRAFSAGETDVLVSTTVIEVGVNVPNATIMAVEDAGRFGLSQLHQLRGRVGRGTRESWCFLLSSETEKLRVLCETNDGFVVARKDLELRGPGELMGTLQAGEPMQGFLPNGDARLLEEVSDCVRELFSRPETDPERQSVARLAESFAREHGYRAALN